METKFISLAKDIPSTKCH